MRLPFKVIISVYFLWVFCFFFQFQFYSKILSLSLHQIIRSLKMSNKILHKRYRVHKWIILCSDKHFLVVVIVVNIENRCCHYNVYEETNKRSRNTQKWWDKNLFFLYWRGGLKKQKQNNNKNHYADQGDLNRYFIEKKRERRKKGHLYNKNTQIGYI